MPGILRLKRFDELATGIRVYPEIIDNPSLYHHLAHCYTSAALRQGIWGEQILASLP
jgi:hypothetical protein